MNNYAMQFEDVVKKYLGSPLTTIYYASYYGDNFQMRAMLFSICVAEINNKVQESGDLQELKKFHDVFASGKSSFQDCINCLKFLDSKKGM